MTDRLHLDFETRSELDLSERGTHNYATHPSTQVLMLAWAVNDSRVRLWEPHRAAQMPPELAEAIEDPFVDKPAWNAPFERSIFLHTLRKDIPLDEWVDTAVWSRYLSMPASLEDAGEVLGLSEGEAKLKEGKELIQLFCIPKALGGGDGLFGSLPTVWNDWSTHPEAWERFCEYCRQDVRTERTIAKKIARLAPPAAERRLWALDQRINERGMPVDMELVAGAAKVAEIERGILDQRLRALTGLENPGSVPQMLAWARQHGYPFNAMGKAFVQRALRGGEGEITPECREALMLRQQASKSSVHKLEALRLMVSADGRLRHQFVFYGAATGRAGARGAQVQNLPRPTKEVEKNMDRAVELLRAGDHKTIAAEFTSPLDVVVSCIRPMFRAPAGKKFVVADLNAIENRVLGWLARSPSMLAVYAEGRCPYIDFATELYGQTYEELWHEYKVLGNGAKRTMAKPAVLGCWAADTLVLTERGWLPIIRVRKTDMLWDGVEWVQHGGVVPQGSKPTIKFFGQRVTPDHRIMTAENEWREAWELLQNTEYARQAFNSACGAWLATTREEVTDSSTAANARDVGLSKTSFEAIWRWQSPNPASPAQMRAYARREAAFTFAFPRLENWWTALQTGTTPSCLDAAPTDTPDMLGAVSPVSSGMSITSSVTSSLYPTLTETSSRSIALTTTGTMPKGTSVSYPQRSTTETRSACASSNGMESGCLPLSSETVSAHSTGIQEQWAARFDEGFQRYRSLRKQNSVVVPTFDVLNSGPRQRFMVWTEMGPLIVHNCGYRLSGGEVTIDENGDEIKTGLLGYADNMGVTMTPDESQRAVDLFRNKYPEVKQYWDELDNTSLQSVRHPGTSVHVGQVAFRCTGTKMLQALLPSGRALHYLQPEIHQNEITFKDRKTGLDKTFIKDTLTYMGKDQQTKQWVRKTTHGGHLTENLCQAIARDILMHGLQKAETTGFEVFGHVHDEAMTMTDADSPLTHRDLEDCMRALPPWAGAGSVQNLDGEVIASWPDLPLNAEGYEDDHYRKG